MSEVLNSVPENDLPGASNPQVPTDDLPSVGGQRPEFDPEGKIKSYFENNLKEHFSNEAGILSASQAKPESHGILDASAGKPIPKTVAYSPSEIWSAGWKNSTMAEYFNGKKPSDAELNKNAGTGDRFLFNAATVAGSLPSYAFGAALGSVTGMGPAAGAMGFDASFRRLMMDEYTRGSVKDFGDFWERTGGSFIDGVKGAVLGKAGEVGGAFTEGLLGPGGMSNIVGMTAGMTATQAAIERRMPQPQEFLDNALLATAIHGVTTTAPKVAQALRSTFAETGVHPSDVVNESKTNPQLAAELVSEVKNYRKIYAESSGQPEEAFNHIDPATGKPLPVQSEFNHEGGAPAATKTDLYHGTNAKFENFDFERGAGMAFFADNEGIAANYAEGTGGQRAALPPTEKYVVDSEGTVYELRGAQEVTKTHVTLDGKKLPYKSWDGGQWEAVGKQGDGPLTNKDNLEPLPKGKEFPPLSQKEAEEITDPDHGDGHVVPKESRIVKHSFEGLNVLDTNTPEGRKVIAGLTPTTTYGKRIIEAAQQEGQPGAPGFGNTFWTSTKANKSPEIRNAIKTDITEPLKAMGYDGIRFWDDAHQSTGLFDSAMGKLAGRKSSAAPSAATTAMTSQIVDLPKAAKPSLLELLPDKQEFFRTMLDKYDPSKRFQEGMTDGEKVPLEQDLYRLQRSTNGTPGLILEGLTGSTPAFENGAPVGEPLSNILSDIKDVGIDQKVLDAGLAAKRVVEVMKNGVKRPIKNPEAAQPFLDEHGKRLEPYMQRYTAWREHWTQYGVDAQLITQKEFNTWKALGDAYVDLKKIVDPTEGSEELPTDENRPTFTSDSLPSSVKKLKGLGEKDLETISPLQSGVESMKAWVKLAERNRAFLKLHADAQDSIDVLGDKSPFTIKNDTEKISVKADKLQAAFDKAGIPGDAKDIELWRQRYNAPLGDNQVRGRVDGVWKIIEGPKDLIQAMKAVDGNIPIQNGLVKFGVGMMKSATNVAKFGYTSSVEFAMRHLFRALELNNVFSEDTGYVGLGDTINAMGELLNDQKGVSTSSDWHAFLRSRGSAGLFTDVIERWANQNIDGLSEQESLPKRLWNGALTPFKKAEVAAQMFDLSVRFAKFKKLNEGNIEGDQMKEAGWAARNAGTGDNTRIGALMAGYNSIAAYQNLHIQTMYKALENIGNDPKRLAYAGFKYITLPTMMLYFWNRSMGISQKIDDEADRYQKDMSFTIGLPFSKFGGEDYVARLPIPPVLGLPFKVVPERLMDQFFNDNPHAWDQFGQTIERMLVPPVIPNIIQPFAEHFMNKKFWTGGPVVNLGMEKGGALPQDQWNAYTTEFAKAVGRIVGSVPGLKYSSFSSPQVIDNYLNTFAGTVGQYLNQFLDAGLAKLHIVNDIKPSWTVFDWPVVKGFLVRTPTMNAEPIHLFKSRYEEYQMNSNSMRQALERQDVDRYQQIIQEAPEAQLKLAQCYSTITHTSTAIQKIMLQKQMDGDDKRQAIEALTYRAIESAKRCNQIMDNAEKAFRGSGQEKALP